MYSSKIFMHWVTSAPFVLSLLWRDDICRAQFPHPQQSTVLYVGDLICLISYYFSSARQQNGWKQMIVFGDNVNHLRYNEIERGFWNIAAWILQRGHDVSSVSFISSRSLQSHKSVFHKIEIFLCFQRWLEYKFLSGKEKKKSSQQFLRPVWVWKILCCLSMAFTLLSSFWNSTTCCFVLGPRVFCR